MISIHLYLMAKEKNKPVPVRFDLKLLELLKEEEKLDTPQQALNFLANFWENNRPARAEDPAHAKDVKAPARKPKSSDLNPSDLNSSDPKSAAPSPKAVKHETITHPSGLSGIDLSIWKAEQKEKNKNA